MPPMARMLLLVYAVLMGITVALQIVFGGSVEALFRTEPRGPLELHVAIGVAVGLAVAGLSQVAARRFAPLREMSDALGEILRPLRHRDVFSQALFSALAEEMFFRGFLQPRLGLHLTSILFGLVHLPRERRLRLWQPLGILLGYLLGWMFQATGSLTAPFLAHFAINYFNMHFVLAEREAT